MIKTTVIDIDHMGNGIAKEDGKILFIPKGVPGDEVLVKIVKKHKKYDEGRILKIIGSGIDRCQARCPYYLECGGCNLSNLSYEKQLEYKKNKIKNIFRRYLNIGITPEIIASEKQYAYRNKITYHRNLRLVSIDNELIEIDKCILVSDKVNELFQLVKKEDLSSLKKLTIRECQNGLILSIDGEIDFKRLKDKCMMIYVNNHVVYQKEIPYLMIGDIKYVVSNKSFFQINTSNIKNLYDVVIKYGKFNEQDQVIDLYCGVGSISLYVARYVKNVLGIEIVEDAVKDAQINALNNNIKNVEFKCGDVGVLIDKYRQYDKVIVDPPRAGLDKHTVEVLNCSGVDRIIYVSCDPMTFVRDVKLLNNYQLIDVTLVDMFPQTHHVESVGLLKLKNNRVKDEKSNS